MILPCAASPGVADQTTPPFQLEVFCTLYKCLQQCWQRGVFLPALVHRFWKLTLQVIALVNRYLPRLTLFQPVIVFAVMISNRSSGEGGGMLFFLFHSEK